MSKTDICQSMLYIKDLSAVIESTNRTHSKPLFVNGRHSDAFIYIVEGGCAYTFDDGVHFSVSAGDVLYLAKDAVYRMDVDEGDYHFIYCDFDFWSDAPRISAVYTPKAATDTYHLFRKLYRTYATSSPHAKCESMAMLYHIYSSVLQTATTTYIGHSARQRIAEVREQIERSCHDSELSVNSLALQAGISEVHLRKLFRSLYGTAPSQYITACRLERAKQLMQYPFLSLEECALQSGFSSLAYFSRVFRGAVGMTPTAYRRTVTKKEM